MKCDSLVTVENMDDTAVGKPIFFQSSTHGLVIPMGVDPQIGALFRRPIEDPGDETLTTMVDSNAVNGAVGLIIQPAGAVDLQIGGVLTLDIGKNRTDLTIVLTNIELFLGNILP